MGGWQWSSFFFYFPPLKPRRVLWSGVSYSAKNTVLAANIGQFSKHVKIVHSSSGKTSPLSSGFPSHVQHQPPSAYLTHSHPQPSPRTAPRVQHNQIAQFTHGLPLSSPPPPTKKSEYNKFKVNPAVYIRLYFSRDLIL